MKTSKPLAVLLIVCTMLFVISGSIAVPLLCRPFYYAHIDALGLTEYTGLLDSQIREAYDQMMDFCLGFREEFSAGVLHWSQSGASHFADVRNLFSLDLRVLAASIAVLAAALVFCRVKKVRPHCFGGHGPGFWAAIGMGAGFLTVGGLAALDFDRAFVIFHALFFPGKDNWMFDWREDPIILLLPQEFFRNCAILILALLLIWSFILILSDVMANRLRRKRCQLDPPPGCGGNCSGCSGCQG